MNPMLFSSLSLSLKLKALLFLSLNLNGDCGRESVLKNREIKGEILSEWVSRLSFL